MRNVPLAVAVLCCSSFLNAAPAMAQDWPQWMGPDRDGRTTGFEAPATWPEELTQEWTVPVGDGVATPSLVGDELFVFSFQDGFEVLYCLDALSGDELWRQEYETEGADGAARGFAGPRSCPTVAEGMVVTMGVRGTLSCVGIDSAEVAWRKQYPEVPRFYTSSSPIVADGRCIVQVGGENEGAVVALDLESGEEQWKWSGGGTSYASPILFTGQDVPMVVAETTRSLVGLRAADGELLWETPFVVRGRGYNAATPVMDGDKIILAGSGRGTRTFSIQKQDAAYAASEVWANEDQSVQYNTPILKDGLVYGLSDSDQLFCIDNESGETLWTAPASGKAAEEAEPEAPRQGRRGSGGRRGSIPAGSGYGSIVDAGTVLFAMTPKGELIVFKPGKDFEELARYRVAESGTYAYPIVSGDRVFVKDKDSVSMWSLGG